MLFDWTPSKAEQNERKHRIAFTFGSRVFDDPNHITYDVTRPDDGEERRKAVGLIEGKLYCVVYTIRVGVCWIISARRSNSGEDRAYAEVRP